MQIDQSEKLENFLSGFGAAVHLSRRAKENNCFIEQVCLYANIIDGMLRLSLIMKDQNLCDGERLNEAYLFQSDDDKIISEKDIYKISLDEKIINDAVFKKLHVLYNKRNKVIHRYIISDIHTKEVKNTAAEYEILMDEIKEIHRKYNDEFLLLNKGIAREFLRNPDLGQMLEPILKKHNGVFIKLPKSN